MSLHRFFLDEQIIAQEADECFDLQLSAGDVKHFRVLRLRAGEHIAVIDAARDYFECEITSTEGALPQVRIAVRGDAPVARAQVILVQGLAKGDKFDEVIRHATELGVTGFVPLTCERSVVKLDAARAQKRVERWHSIARSAAMQAGREQIPSVEFPCDAAAAAQLLQHATAVLVCWEEAPSDAVIDEAIARALEEAPCAPTQACVALVVGPEGGLTHREVETFLALERSAAITLGPSILRTETAGIVAPALVLHELARLGRAHVACGEDTHTVSVEDTLKRVHP